MKRVCFLFFLCFSFQSNAALIIWDFEVEITETYEDQLDMFPGLSLGSTFTGYFGYDSDIQQTNVDTYANYYESDSLVFGLDFMSDANDIEWQYKSVSVVHQGRRDIVDFELEFGTSEFESNIEIGFLDYSQSYGQGELPINWHNLNGIGDTPEFYFEAEDTDLELLTEIEGEFINFSLRETTEIPAPASIFLIAPLLSLLLRRVRA